MTEHRIAFNFNDTIEVELTEAGRERVREVIRTREWDTGREHPARAALDTRRSGWRLWEFAEMFGPVISHAGPVFTVGNAGVLVQTREAAAAVGETIGPRPAPPDLRDTILAEMDQGFRDFLGDYVKAHGLPTAELAAFLNAAFAAGCTHGLVLVKRHGERRAAGLSVAPSDPGA
jgi:hypothetical protein